MLTIYFLTITIRVKLSGWKENEAGLAEIKQTAGQSPSSRVKTGQSAETGTLFERVSFEKQLIEDKAFVRCRFEDAYFKNAELHHCEFHHTRFVYCYFRAATFSGTKFRGCLFDFCNFEGATFHDCDLEYSEFLNSRIKYSQLSGCFPKWPNVLLRFARSLRKNAQSLGDAEEYRRFLSLELEASEQHDLNVFTKYDNYYHKYRFIERAAAFKRWLFMKVERLVWGHGEKWSRVLWTAALLAVFFALLFQFTNARLQNMPTNPTFWNFLALSLSKLLGVDYGTVTPANSWARVLILGERVGGFVVLGFLVTSLYLRISKR